MKQFEFNTKSEPKSPQQELSPQQFVFTGKLQAPPPDVQAPVVILTQDGTFKQPLLTSEHASMISPALLKHEPCLLHASPDIKPELLPQVSLSPTLAVHVVSEPSPVIVPLLSLQELVPSHTVDPPNAVMFPVLPLQLPVD